MNASVAVGLVKLACDSIVRSCGFTRAELLAGANLEPELLADPDTLIDMSSLVELLRWTRLRTSDPGLGVRLARVVDLREQGFWGYAVLSSGSLRQRVETHVRYQPLRTPWSLTLRTEGALAVLDVSPHAIPEDVLPMLIDWIVATALLHVRANFGQTPRGIQLWLSYPEQAHHRELASLFEGHIVFDAPCIRIAAPLELLDRPMPGDPHLASLVRKQLDARLDDTRHTHTPRALIERVRERVAARLDHDASLSRIARDLRMSARTLQRQLEAEGASFDAEVEQIRRAHALKSIGETEQSVACIATRLGYADASSFRRAFRRWTGVSPGSYRAELRTRVAAPVLKVPKLARKASSG